MKTVVSSKGQIVLPAELRQRDRIVPGQRFEIERLAAGQYILKKQEGSDNHGLVDWHRADTANEPRENGVQEERLTCQIGNVPPNGAAD